MADRAAPDEETDDVASPTEELLRELAVFSERSPSPAPSPSEPFRGGGRFTVVRRLGSGGFGVVYEVEERSTGRRLALKTLTRADPRSIIRFKREFRALADLDHPNLVRLEELVGEENGLYFTMELVDGDDALRFVRPHGELDEARLRAVLGQLATALGALHARGFVHRDVKPSNAIVDRAGRLVLLDFGLVAPWRERGEQSLDFIAGTPFYAAPEQLAGKEATPAADWFSVGVFLHYALATRPPRRTRAGDCELAPECADAPADLQALCARLMQRDPARRAAKDDVAAAADDSQGSPGPLSITAERRARTFVGRAEPLATLDYALERARAKKASVVLVSGPAGIGKSALLARFLAGARASALVLVAHPRESERLSFRALDGAFDMLARWLMTAEGRAVDLSRIRGAAELVKQFPALAAARPGGAEQTTVAERGRAMYEAGDPRRATSALRELFTAIAATRPIALVIDDAESGDRESAELLAEVLTGDQAPPLLVVIAHRPVADASFVAAYEDAIRRGASPPPIRIELGALDSTDAEALARAFLPASPIATTRAIAEEAGGAPSLVAEIARAVRAGAPLCLDELIGQRLASLPASARALVEVIALAPPPIDLAIAIDVARVDPAAARDALAELAAARLLGRRGGRALELRHHRFTTAIAAAIAPDRAGAIRAELAARARVTSSR